MGLRTADDVLRFRGEVDGRFGRELAQRPRGADKIILSNEHIHSRLTTVEEAKCLHDFVQAHCEVAKVIVYLRRQDRVAVSLYSTRFRVAATRLTPVFPKPAKAIPPYYDYYRLLDLFSQVFGAEKLTIRVFEKEKLRDQDLLADFADVIGLRIDRQFTRPQWLNSGLRPSAIRFLAEFNRHVPWMIDGKLNPYRRDVLRAIDTLFVGDAPLVSRSQAKKFYSQFRRRNEQTRERFLPAIAAPLFSEGFDDYPEQEPAMDARYEDAVEMAAQLWKFMVRELQARDGTADRAPEEPQAIESIGGDESGAETAGPSVSAPRSQRQ
jgi:hypothetical protein